MSLISILEIEIYLLVKFLSTPLILRAVAENGRRKISELSNVLMTTKI